MKEKSDGRIVVAYCGNLANRMQWSESKLEELEKKADLGAVITIRSVTQRIPTGAVSMRDEMAMKSYKSPLEIIKANKPDNITYTRIDFMSGSSDVLIDDQLATDKATDKWTRQIKPDKFVSSINNSVKKGLDDLITKEKLYNLQTTLKFYTSIASAVPGIAGGGYFWIYGIRKILESLPDHDPVTGGLKMIEGMGWFAVGEFIFFTTFRLSRFLSHNLRQKGKLAYLFLNPLKPIKDIIFTKAFLAGEGGKLVELK